METKGNITVKTVYFYFFSGVGLILVLLGSYLLINYVVKNSQFDTYPLDNWEETQCTDSVIRFSVPLEEGKTATSEAETQKLQEECKRNLETMRQIRRTKDATQALALVGLGLIVFAPHWKLARKTDR